MYEIEDSGIKGPSYLATSLSTFNGISFLSLSLVTDTTNVLGPKWSKY